MLANREIVFASCVRACVRARRGEAKLRVRVKAVAFPTGAPRNDKSPGDVGGGAPVPQNKKSAADRGGNQLGRLPPAWPAFVAHRIPIGRLARRAKPGKAPRGRP